MPYGYSKLYLKSSLRFENYVVTYIVAGIYVHLGDAGPCQDGGADAGQWYLRDDLTPFIIIWVYNSLQLH